MLLDGEHLLEEALASGVRIDVAAFGNGLPEGRLAALAARIARAGTTTIAVTDPVLAVMSPVRQPSGVVAIAERRPVTLDEVSSASRAAMVRLKPDATNRASRPAMVRLPPQRAQNARRGPRLKPDATNRWS